MREPRRHPRPRRGGFSLLEVVISVGLVTLVFLSTGVLAQRASATFDQGAFAAELDADSHRTLRAVAEELSEAGFDDMSKPSVLGESFVDYRRSLNWNGGAILWSDWMRVEFQYEQGELDNGIDDNGNGLVDEGIVVRRVNPGQLDERRFILCRGVREYLEGEEADGGDTNGNGLRDERGLCFELLGDTVVVRLTLERANPDGRLSTRTVQTAVKVRN